MDLDASTSHTSGENKNFLIEKMSELETLCRKLQAEVAQLTNENQKLKSQIENKMDSNANQTTSKVVYCTDEEELANETNWIVQKHKKRNRNKKRKAESSPEVDNNDDEAASSPQMKQISQQIANERPKTIRKPPPIMISGVKEYNVLLQTVATHVKKEFSIKLLSNEVYKINTADSTDYRSLTAFFSSSKASWYTYQDKQLRPINVIAKNLHHSCMPVDIVSDLKNQGFKVLNAVNKLQWRTKKPLNLFMLSFESSEDVNKIHGIRSILNSIVKIEPVRNSKLIPQCKKCQSYGHTKNYCGKDPRCVRCAGKHETENCERNIPQKPKCCNCGEEHPANYRGCAVAKELQKMCDQRKKELNQTQNSRPTIPPQHPPAARNLRGGRTFAEVAKDTNENVSGGNKPNMLYLLQTFMQKQEAFNKQLERRLVDIEKSLY